MSYSKLHANPFLESLVICLKIWICKKHFVLIHSNVIQRQSIFKLKELCSTNMKNRGNSMSQRHAPRVNLQCAKGSQASVHCLNLKFCGCQWRSLIQKVTANIKVCKIFEADRYLEVLVIHEDENIMVENTFHVCCITYIRDGKCIV